MKSKKSAWQKDVTEYLVRNFLTRYAFYENNIKINDIENRVYRKDI